MRSGGWIFTVLIVGILLSPAGCSQLASRLHRPGLPSPQATIEASEKAVGQASRLPGAVSEPRDVAAALERGRAHERSGQYDKAGKIYDAALREHPENTLLLHRAGIAADMRKDHAVAEKYFRAAAAQQPTNAELMGDLGYCYYLQGKLDEANKTLTKAVELAPQDARHHNNLGLVLGHQRDYEGAFAQFSAAGSQADAFYNMAFVFAGQNLVDEAKGCFQEALAADPSHERARQALASFEEYDRLPPDRRDREVADSGVRYVPYVEPADEGQGNGDVQQASAISSLPNTREIGAARGALHLRSQGLLQRHMQQSRANDQGSNAK